MAWLRRPDRQTLLSDEVRFWLLLILLLTAVWLDQARGFGKTVERADFIQAGVDSAGHSAP